MKRIHLYTIIFAIVLSACNDYLDIEPKGIRIPNSIEDYDLLLAPVTKIYIEDELFLSADDFVSNPDDLGDLTDKENKKVHIYTFSDRRFDNPETEIPAWNMPYSNIYVYNKVINEIDDASESIGYSSDDKKIIKAEALYGRAAQYFFLVNMFAKHYNKATAASDPGVPLVLEANTSMSPPQRASVAQTYDLIIENLNEAIPNLPTKGKELNRPTKGSGYALLARIYLYRQEYDLALKNAELALQENAQLSDYTTEQDIGELYNNEQYSQLFFGYIMGHYYGVLGEEMVNMYDNENDVRFTTILGCTWVQDPETGQWSKDCSIKKIGFQITPNPLPTIAEMYLITAECYARSNKISETLIKLNELRRNRIYDVVDKQEGDFENSEELLKFVFDERRRELLMSGTRLFDLKRLNLDSQYAKTITHKLNEDVYQAEPNSGKLILPIPAQVKKLNPSLN